MIVSAGKSEVFDFSYPIGVGMVVSAINLTQLCLFDKPEFLLFVGSAGSYGEHNIFDVVQSKGASNIELSFLQDKSYSVVDNVIVSQFDNIKHQTIVNSSNYVTTDFELAKSYNKLTLKSLNTKSTGLNNTIGSQKILILDPMKFDFGEYSPKSIFLGNSTFSNKVTYYDNYNVTIERFKNLNKYGIIIISTHSNKDGVILTGQQATKNLIKQYSADIKKKRLFTYKHEVLVKDGGFWFWEPDDTEEKVDVFILNPSFIKYYNKNLPNSLVYLGMCSGMETGNPLPQILIKIGAKAVVGYNNTVNASYDNSIVSTFFTTMLDKKTLKESLNEAKKQHGVNDEANGKKDNPPTPAEPIFAGDGTLKLFKEGIENGSFEDNLKFWTNEGDARVLSKLGSLKPQNGVLMSIIMPIWIILTIITKVWKSTWAAIIWLQQLICRASTV
jgi:hypothetical protein